MRFSLADLVRRQRNPRRSVIPIRRIVPPASRATDLYRSAYAPVLAVWEGAVPAIVAQYQRSLSELQTDSAVDIRAELEQADSAATGVIITVRARIERWTRIFEAWHRSRWRAAVLTATSVDLSTMLGPADVRLSLEAVIERNVGLVKSVSDQARGRIADSVFRGLRERKPADAVAKEIREAVAMGRRRARNIAADQLSKLSGELDQERRRQAGIAAWEWRHSGKLHPREDHVARNGKLYSDDPADVGTEYEGRTVRKPPEDRPSQLPFCACGSKAVLIL